MKHALLRAVEKKGESQYFHVQYVVPFTRGAGRGTVSEPRIYFDKIWKRHLER
jgi:hypothetical protein